MGWSPVTTGALAESGASMDGMARVSEPAAHTDAAGHTYLRLDVAAICSAKSGALVSRLRAADGSQYSDFKHVESATTAARSHESDNAQAMHLLLCNTCCLALARPDTLGSLKPNSACIASI
jgi:hypothetical protein